MSRVYLRDRGWADANAPLRLRVAEFPALDLFTHAVEGGFRVSEATTGLAVVTSADGVAATFLTRGEAIGAALATLRRWGSAHAAQTTERVLKAREQAS